MTDERSLLEQEALGFAPPTSAIEEVWRRADRRSRQRRIATRMTAIAIAVLVLGVALRALSPIGHHIPANNAPAGTIIWVRQFGSDGLDVGAEGVAVSGSITYVSSSWWDRHAYGSVQAKLDSYGPDGNPLGEQSAPADSPAGVVATDPSGNVYLLQADIGDVYDSTVGIAGTVTKYSPGGTLLWSRNLELDGFASGLAADDGGVYVAGGTRGRLHNQDGFVANLDGDGNLRWHTTLGTNYFDRAGPIAVDAGGIYVAGESGGAAGPSTVWKVDRTGSVVWSRSIDTGRNLFSAVAVGGGAVYVGGEDDRDALVAAYDTDGTRLWTRRWGSGGEDSVAGLAATDTGVIVAGTAGLRSARDGGGSRVVAAEGSVRALDADGTTQWATAISNGGVVIVTSIGLGAYGLYVVGDTEGTFPGQTATRGQMGFLARLGTEQVVPPASPVGGARPSSLPG